MIGSVEALDGNAHLVPLHSTSNGQQETDDANEPIAHPMPPRGRCRDGRGKSMSWHKQDCNVLNDLEQEDSDDDD